MEADPQTPESPSYRLGELVLYALRLGTLGFGGPVALVGSMHRDLVECKGWFSEAEYREGLTLAQLMPGPLAAQLAIYLGYAHYSVLGATLVGLAFVLPSFVMVVALGWAYVSYGGLPWMQAVFYGVGAAVIGIITNSALKLAKKTVAKRNLLIAIAAISAIVTVVSQTEYVLLFLAAGVLVWFLDAPPWGKSPPSPAAVSPALLLAMTSVTDEATKWPVYWSIAAFFTKAGAFVFGSGLAIVPFLYGGVVKEYGWLNDAEFMDAVAVAMITPGPVVITVGFIGYLTTGREAGFASGLAGASVAALATFLPCYLLTILPAPYFKKHGKQPGIVAFVDGVTAAAVGAILGACVVLGLRTLAPEGVVVWPKVLLAAAALVMVVRWSKTPEPLIVAMAAAIGLALASVGG